MAEILEVPPATIADDVAMNDLDAWDSLKHMELISSIEQRFGIELSFDEIVAMRSGAEIKRVLRERGAIG